MGPGYLRCEPPGKIGTSGTITSNIWIQVAYRDDLEICDKGGSFSTQAMGLIPDDAWEINAQNLKIIYDTLTLVSKSGFMDLNSGFWFRPSGFGPLLLDSYYSVLWSTKKACPDYFFWISTYELMKY